MQDKPWICPLCLVLGKSSGGVGDSVLGELMKGEASALRERLGGGDRAGANFQMRPEIRPV